MLVAQSLRSCGGYQLKTDIETETNTPPIRLQRSDKLLEVPPAPILKTFCNELLFFLELLLRQSFSYMSLVSENIARIPT